MKINVGVAIVTYCAEKQIELCLKPFIDSPLNPRLLVIDSASPDSTVTRAQALGAQVYSIPRSQFNHGTTRELARILLNCEIVVMCTQDAHPQSASLLEELIAPIIEGKAAISYARQIPQREAGFLASFARQFNYPQESQLRKWADLPTYGAYTFFCSNSCAAYSNDALEKIGGFRHCLLGEDTVTAAKLLHSGKAIAYVAQAIVRHSHDFTLRQEFRRYFAIGMARWQSRHWFAAAGSVQKRGTRYAQQLLLKLCFHQPWLLPYGLLHLIVKFLGYYFGRYLAYLKELAK